MLMRDRDCYTIGEKVKERYQKEQSRLRGEAKRKFRMGKRRHCLACWAGVESPMR